MPTLVTRRRAFVQLCDAFDIPIVSLCDTPGFMVGPEAEKTALVRHVSRMFVTAASNHGAVFHRRAAARGYGLGAQAMAGGGFHAQNFTISLADRRIRRHGLRGRGAARLPQGDGGDRRSGGARQILQGHGRKFYETARPSISPRCWRSTR